MTNSEGWVKPPEGDLLFKIDTYDRNNPQHQQAIEEALRDTVGTVSRTHGASLDMSAIRENLRLLNESDEDDPDIIFEFLQAKWDVCEAKSPKGQKSPPAPKNTEDQTILLGGATGWFDYHYDQSGKLHRSYRLEDFALFDGGKRKLVKSKPKGMEKPKGSLATWFYWISLQNFNFKHSVAYRLGEVAPDNKTMLDQLHRNNAQMGMGLDSAVLEFNQMPSGLLDLFPETVKIRPIWNKGKKSKRSFIVRWKDGDHDVRFIVTKGRSTTAGVPRIDIQPWDNGNPPNASVLQSVVAATLKAIEEEAEKREWGLKKRPFVPSPNISHSESRQDIFKSLFEASADRAAIPGAEASNTFAAPMPSIHVHIIGKSHMIGAFKEVDAQMRFFGGKPMIPGVNHAEPEAQHLVPN